MKKTLLLISLLLIAVGFALVTTSLYINGSTTITSNEADFKVYYSDAYVNGTQDLTVIKDDRHISFTTTLDTIGQKYVLDYDVTNGSKNYNADLEMVCTSGNEYLSVTNNFDDVTILDALDTRRGTLTLEMIKSNVGDEQTVNIECTINVQGVERTSLAEGEAAAPVEPVNEAMEFCDSLGGYEFGELYTPDYDVDKLEGWYIEGDITKSYYLCHRYPEGDNGHVDGYDKEGNRVFTQTSDRLPN